MPITIQCTCGRNLKAKDEAAGRKVRCPQCAAVLAVPKPSALQDGDDEDLNYLMTEAPAKSGTKTTRRHESTAIVESEKVRRPAPSPPPPQPRRPEPKPIALPKSKKRSRDRDERRSGPRLVIAPEIITGILMMVGAAVWFFVGLAAGFIYFYPPILFVLGIGAIIRGITGRE